MNLEDPRRGEYRGYQRHGSTTGYRGGCRCADCRRAVADQRQRQRNRKYLERIDSLLVDPTGTHRRIQALVALGWSQSEISRQAGYHRSHVKLVLRRQNPIHRDTATRFAALYDRLSMALPPERTKEERIAAAYARNLAKKKGWLPPLAYDDARIDDPTYKPNAGTDRKLYRTDELLAEVDHLARAGESVERIAQRLGVSVEAIEKARERARKRGEAA